ncbi:hypothetical protein C1646_761321 [Rhizophagus diaphanus]|nr:hypothetical protein C1646_761321 [Rhizophagus diaphanus] [Rhizophagus sp. MUCL 43196]
MSEAILTFTTGNESLMLADEIKKYKTNAFIEFLKKEENLKLDDDDLKVIRKEKVNGRDFLKLTEEKLERHGMKLGPALRLADFIKEYAIRQFPPKTYTLKDDDEELEQYIREIKRRLGNMGTILADSNEAIITKKKITLALQLEIVDEENIGRVNYAIKALEKLICITEGKLYQVVIGFAQNLVQCENAFYELSTLKENLKKKKELCKNVKRMIEIIVGLLKDRVDVKKELAIKKQRVQEWLFGSLGHEISTTFSGYLDAWEFGIPVPAWIPNPKDKF